MPATATRPERYAVVWDCEDGHKLWTGSFPTREDAEKSIRKKFADRSTVRPWSEWRIAP